MWQNPRGNLRPSFVSTLGVYKSPRRLVEKDQSMLADDPLRGIACTDFLGAFTAFTALSVPSATAQKSQIFQFALAFALRSSPMSESDFGWT